MNDKIDLDFVKKYSHKNWSNKLLGMKEFKIDESLEKNKILEKYAIKIQRWWMDIYYNPRSKIRQKILNHQFDEYINNQN